MKKEDKQLLLKDLCARLPYGVKISTRIKGNSNFRDSELSGELLDDFVKKDWGIIKPYLRPMSSMTEEEAKTFVTLWGIKDFTSLDITEEYIGVVCDDGFSSTTTTEIWYDEDMPIKCYDFLNAHHLDYRGLIPMGLALPAPEGMYNF